MTPVCVGACAVVGTHEWMGHKGDLTGQEHHLLPAGQACRQAPWVLEDHPCQEGLSPRNRLINMPSQQQHKRGTR